MQIPRFTREWAEWMRGAGMSARTITDRVELVERFEQTLDFGSSLVADWRSVSRFLGNDAWKPGTRQTYYANLRAWFHWLVLMDHRIDDPTIKVKTPKPVKRKPRPVSLTQLGRMLATRHHHRTTAMMLLGAYEGFRVSEIAKVRGEDFTDDLLYVLGKGEVEAYLPIHPLVAEIAQSMPRRGYWFPSHVKPNRPIAGKSVSAIISHLMDRANVPGTPHALRHFYGTELLKENGNLALTQQLMRHANPATTVLYTEVDPALRRATVDALPIPPGLVLLPNRTEDNAQIAA